MTFKVGDRVRFKADPAPPTISLDKQYRTRDGREVRLLMVDGGGGHPVVGAIKEGGKWVAKSWAATGDFLTDDNGCDDDLIEVKPEITGWANINGPCARNNYGKCIHLYETREVADAAKCPDRIACIPITFREGDGL